MKAERIATMLDDACATGDVERMERVSAYAKMRAEKHHPDLRPSQMTNGTLRCAWYSVYAAVGGRLIAYRSRASGHVDHALAWEESSENALRWARYTGRKS